jgi:hypothetical protein
VGWPRCAKRGGRERLSGGAANFSIFSDLHTWESQQL